MKFFPQNHNRSDSYGEVRVSVRQVRSNWNFHSTIHTMETLRFWMRTIVEQWNHFNSIILIAIYAALNELKFHILTAGDRARDFFCSSQMCRDCAQFNRKLTNSSINRNGLTRLYRRFKISLLAVINKFYVFVSLINVQSASFCRSRALFNGLHKAMEIIFIGARKLFYYKHFSRL